MEDTILETTGVSSHEKVAQWTKKELTLRRIGDHESAFHRGEAMSLYRDRFEMSQIQASLTYKALVTEDLIREHTGIARANPTEFV